MSDDTQGAMRAAPGDPHRALIAKWRRLASEALSEMSRHARGTPNHDFARIELATWKRCADDLEALLGEAGGSPASRDPLRDFFVTWPKHTFANVLRQSGLGLTEGQLAGVSTLVAEAVEKWAGGSPASAPPPQEIDVIQQCVDHWFTQGGQSQFGDFTRTVHNADELIAEILRLVRAAPASAPLAEDVVAALQDAVETARSYYLLFHDDAWKVRLTKWEAALTAGPPAGARLRELLAACIEVDNGSRRCVLCRQSRHMDDWTDEAHETGCLAVGAFPFCPRCGKPSSATDAYCASCQRVVTKNIQPAGARLRPPLDSKET